MARQSRNRTARDVWTAWSLHPPSSRPTPSDSAGKLVTRYCKWPHTHEAQSVPVNLVAGKRYYLEVLQKPRGGATQLCVRWRLPNGVEERPIPGARLTPPSRDL